MFSFLKKNKPTVITRMAPSPTGYFHIGGVRTALFNYLFTKQNKGKFILRIDDTDDERNKPEYEENIVRVFDWLGLDYDEKVNQSDRKSIYKKHLQKLIKEDKAYEAEKSESGEGRVIRFRNPNSKIKFKDIILGEIEVETKDLDDFIIAKNFDNPVYHFTSVVDDGEMNITHVIRGQEHLANTPRQIIILEALGFSRPQYAHIPLILSPNGGKLSKRDADVIPALDYKKRGILPEALINFLAFIGWNPGGEREIYSKSQLIDKFNLKKVQKGGGVFNIDKLHWINKQYLKEMTDEEFHEYVSRKIEWFDKIENFDRNKLIKIVPMIKERIENYADLEKMISEGELDYFFKRPQYDVSKVVWKKDSPTDTKHLLSEVRVILERLNEMKFDKQLTKDAIWKLAEEKGKGSVLWPIRYALSGRDKSPSPFELLEILGKEESLARIKHAIDKL